MRKTNLATFLAPFFLLLFAVGCTDDDGPSNNTQNEIESDVQKGTWKITKFIDSDKDETNDFAGYDFTFLSSGVLRADNGATQYDGTWSITDSNSNDDSHDDGDVHRKFNLTNEFEDLNEEGDIRSRASAKSARSDVSGGPGGTVDLTGEKK